jgi:diaminohydroxyphosphoribosylaminopyrimidine deaminase/5-amino-6-(5-phosphoribosylamino)uracil reductase
MTDATWMRAAYDASLQGVGRVNPNPLVGAVVTHNDVLIATGYHACYGSDHAEVMAFKQATECLEGATLYVTLEPCSHYGKTPPCVDAIIAHKIKRCVVACLDPNPLVAGRGIKRLQEHGIEVTVGVLHDLCASLNAPFFKYITAGIPYIFLKCGITLDGKMATASGSSKWITNEQARAKAQYYRHKFMAIMVGKNTILYDDPSLHTKMPNGRHPYRIFFDAQLEIDEKYQVISNNSDKKTIIITLLTNKHSGKALHLQKWGVHFIFMPSTPFVLGDVFKKIGERGIDSVLVEGGGDLISQLFKENLIDEGEIFVAPTIIGDAKAHAFVHGFSPQIISNALRLSQVSYTIYDDNIGVHFKRSAEEIVCLPD